MEHLGRSEQERIKDDKGDLIALFKQLKDSPMEEGLDLLALGPEGRISTFISDDSDRGTDFSSIRKNL